MGLIPGQGTQIPHGMCLWHQKVSVPCDHMAFFFWGGVFLTQFLCQISEGFQKYKCVEPNDIYMCVKFIC